MHGLRNQIGMHARDQAAKSPTELSMLFAARDYQCRTDCSDDPSQGYKVSGMHARAQAVTQPHNPSPTTIGNSQTSNAGQAARGGLARVVEAAEDEELAAVQGHAVPRAAVGASLARQLLPSPGGNMQPPQLPVVFEFLLRTHLLVNPSVNP